LTRVVDSSVLVAALVDSGPDGAWSEETLAEDSLIAPELVLVEASNVLRRLERSDQISTPEANLAHKALLRLEIELFPFAPFADRVWELRGSLTCYDAWYVAMAESFDCPLATLDLKLSRASGPMCKIITAAGSRPSP
jgi:predicted nucleic acid-binding protein